MHVTDHGRAAVPGSSVAPGSAARLELRYVSTRVGQIGGGDLERAGVCVSDGAGVDRSLEAGALFAVLVDLGDRPPSRAGLSGPRKGRELRPTSAPSGEA